MKEGGTKDPLLYLSLWREWGLQRPDTAAGQARICARDKTGNRKETTQTPALPNVTEPPFIFQEERKKNNINNITCSEGKWMRGKGGIKGEKMADCIWKRCLSPRGIVGVRDVIPKEGK